MGWAWQLPDQLPRSARLAGVLRTSLRVCTPACTAANLALFSVCVVLCSLEELRVPECKPWLPAADGAAGVSSEASGGGKLRNSGSPAPASLQAHDQPESAAALQPQQQPRSRRQGRLSGGAPLRPSLDMALPSAADAATHHALSAALKQPARQQVCCECGAGAGQGAGAWPLAGRVQLPVAFCRLRAPLPGAPCRPAVACSTATSPSTPLLCSRGCRNPVMAPGLAFRCAAQ